MDASFWVAVAFVLFVALIAKRGYQFITEGLDKRAGRIKTELDEATSKFVKLMISGFASPAIQSISRRTSLRWLP